MISKITDLTKINWGVRIKNPTFWFHVATAIIMPILTYFGLKLEDLTTWSMIGELALDAVSNPYVLGTIAFALWGVITDPTTAGLSDSEQALTYSEPKEN